MIGTTTTIPSFSNVDVIRRLSAKGCIVNIKNNSFNESTIDELNNLTGVTAK